MEECDLFAAFGLCLEEVVMGIDDICFGSGIFSIHVMIRNYNFWSMGR